MPSTKLRRCGNVRRRTRLSLPGSKRDFVRPKLRRCICFALTKDLVNDARDGRGGVDYNAVLRDVFFRLMPSAMSSRSVGFPPPHSSSGRSSSRRFNVARSTSRTKTPSNISINFEEFLEPPQKNVTVSSWLATKALTLPTCQMWCSCAKPSVGSPVSGSPR